jgi:hypothetical protein
VKILKYAIVGLTAGLTLSAHACTVLEFGAENLLYPRQNTPELNFQELKAFAAGVFLTQPIFTGSRLPPRLNVGFPGDDFSNGHRFAMPIHYSKNFVPYDLFRTGSHATRRHYKRYASASGFSDSPHTFFNNQDFGGSGARRP